MRGSSYLRRYLSPAAVLLGMLALSACRGDGESRGFASLRLGDYPTAIRAFTAEVEADPSAYGPRLGLGQALLQKAAAESDSAAFAYGLIQLEACRTLRPAAELDGLLADAWVDRARALARQRDTLRALEALARASERHPRSTAALNLAGILYGKRGDPAKAEALFRKSLEADSSDPSARFNLGMLRWRAGDAREAHAHWLKALAGNPGDEDILYWFALAEKRMREAP